MTTNTLPSLDELEATLKDKTKVADLFKEGKFGDFVKDYADAKYKAAGDLDTLVREQTQAVLAQWLKDNPDAKVKRLDLAPDDHPGTGATALARQKSKIYNSKAMGAKLDKEFPGTTGLGDFFRTIWHNTDGSRPEIQEMRGKLRNAFSTTVPSEGGFLVPETMRAELLSVSLENAIVRPRATVIPMESQRLPMPCIDSTSNQSSVFGGFVAYWTEEGATLTESQANFGRIVLDASKLVVYSEVPNELVSDSAVSFTAFMDQMLPLVIGFYEDDSFMNGNGVGQPLGFLNNPAAVSVAAEAGQAAGTILWENIVKMYSRMLPSSLGNAVWIASINTFPELATMALSVGTGGSAVWLNNGADGPPMTILGRPVIFTEKAPALGTTGDIAFVDLRYYLIGDRQAMSATSSPHFKFNQDKTAFRIIERVDGRPWMQSAITPKNAGPTLSPFVQIATR